MRDWHLTGGVTRGRKGRGDVRTYQRRREPQLQLLEQVVRPAVGHECVGWMVDVQVWKYVLDVDPSQVAEDRGRGGSPSQLEKKNKA